MPQREPFLASRDDAGFPSGGKSLFAAGGDAGFPAGGKPFFPASGNACFTASEEAFLTASGEALFTAGGEAFLTASSDAGILADGEARIASGGQPLRVRRLSCRRHGELELLPRRREDSGIAIVWRRSREFRQCAPHMLIDLAAKTFRQRLEGLRQLFFKCHVCEVHCRRGGVDTAQ